MKLPAGPLKDLGFVHRVEPGISGNSGHGDHSDHGGRAGPGGRMGAVALAGESRYGGGAARQRRGRGQTCSWMEELSSSSAVPSERDDSGEAGRWRVLEGSEGLSSMGTGLSEDGRSMHENMAGLQLNTCTLTCRQGRDLRLNCVACVLAATVLER
jgi:hypothetical protein